MWFRKEAPEYVWCVGCGCLMNRAWKKVEVVEWGNLRTETYCGVCAPSYDMRCLGDADSSNTLFIGSSAVNEKPRYYRKKPAQNIEITEKGKGIS